MSAAEAETAEIQHRLRELAEILPDEELRAAVADEGMLAEPTKAELEKRAKASQEPASAPETPFEGHDLPTDAILLRLLLLELYNEGDAKARQQPRFRRAAHVLERSEYLAGGDSPCNGAARCGCDAHEVLALFAAEDGARARAARAAEDAETQVAGVGTVRRVR